MRLIEKNSHLPEVDLMDFCLSDILPPVKLDWNDMRKFQTESGVT